jgi:transcriptional regulator with XRE-family HTH domain
MMRRADPTSSMRSFGFRIRQYREALGVSQEEFAHRCGLHRTYYGGIERGERNPALRNILRIAHELKVDPGELIRGL